MKVATRVLPVTPGERPELAAIEANIVAQRGAISPLYQMLLNSAPLATGWEQLLTAVRNQSSVPADLRELVILRVATLNRAPFEFAAHVPHARRSGVTEEKLAALKDATNLGPFTEQERAILALADAMTVNVQVPDTVFAAAVAGFDAQTQVELVATIAAYNMVSRFLEALRIGH
jgi:4-carboxymuconolactone decarboxylase